MDVSDAHFMLRKIPQNMR